MITPITRITKEDAQRLRRKPYGTNGKSVIVTAHEVKSMKAHLDTVYNCNITFAFAEKICKNNKVY